MEQKHNILITRELSSEQLSLAESLGLNVVAVPAVRFEFRDDWRSVRAMLQEIENPVFAFTSRNGVKGFERFRQTGINLPRSAPVYAVGKATARALDEIGLKARLPQQQDGTGLAKKIVEDTDKNLLCRNEYVILHFCGDRRRDEFRHYLTGSGIRVNDVVVYRTLFNEMNLSDPSSSDAVLFYSPSAVQSFRNSGGFGIGPGAPGPELFAIGNTTAQKLSVELGRDVHISPEPSTEALLEFVAQILNKKSNDEEKVPLRRGKKAHKRLRGMTHLPSRGYSNKNLKELARQLRKNSTKAEVRLWTDLLQGKKTGFTFHRQRPVLNYIADFLCKELKLIIELDGYSHEFEQQWKKDQERQNELEEIGFTIVRFTDDKVMNDIQNVESEIMFWIEKLSSNSPPSTKGERTDKGGSGG